MARRREFDIDKALKAVMHLFWEKGYEGTSYNDLSIATGLVRPSLYAAFGNKEELFLKAIEHYSKEEACFFSKALEQSTIRAVLEDFLSNSIKMVTQEGKPQGCLGINGALACSDESLPLQKELNKRRLDALNLFEQRFNKAQLDGDLPKNINTTALSYLVMSIAQGAAVHAKAGASREQLLEMMEIHLQMFHALCAGTTCKR